MPYQGNTIGWNALSAGHEPGALISTGIYEGWEPLSGPLEIRRGVGRPTPQFPVSSLSFSTWAPGWLDAADPGGPV